MGSNNFIEKINSINLINRPTSRDNDAVRFSNLNCNLNSLREAEKLNFGSKFFDDNKKLTTREQRVSIFSEFSKSEKNGSINLPQNLPKTASFLRQTSPCNVKKAPNRLKAQWSKFLNTNTNVQDDVSTKPESNLKLNSKSFRGKQKTVSESAIDRFTTASSFYKKRDEIREKQDNNLNNVDANDSNVEAIKIEVHNSNLQRPNKAAKKYYDVIFDNSKKFKVMREQFDKVSEKYEQDNIEIQAKRVYDSLTTLNHRKYKQDPANRPEYKTKTETQTQEDKEMADTIIKFTKTHMGIPKMCNKLKRENYSFFTTA